MDCALCQPAKSSELHSSQHWRVLVNHNQNKLGKCLICLERHEEDICNLSEDEVRDLWEVIRLLKVTLVSCFRPDHFNYAFLMNQDHHVHLHVIPRYYGKRVFAGIEFLDDEAVTDQRLSEQIQRQIVEVLAAGMLRNVRKDRSQV
jgi:diadenosine tetraphosphate (Ap4A) HIT family hydrolase